MHPTFLSAVAIPESDEAPGELLARLSAVAEELERVQPVDWEEDLARGGGPCLALGAERRSNPR